MLKPADVPVADGWTVSWVQPVGMVYDGSSSACTDPGRFALAELLACVLAELLAAGGGDPELLPFRANAAPAPTAAATTTAAPINPMVRPRRFRPAGRRGPPVPAEYGRARSGYGCDGPAYCAFGPGCWANCAFEPPPCLPYCPYRAFEPPY